MNTEISNTCPTCHETTCQHKDGFNHSSSQRYQCQHCRRTYTPEPKMHGYELSLRQMALKFRRIGRLLGVSHQTVVNWTDAATARLPSPPTSFEQQR